MDRFGGLLICLFFIILGNFLLVFGNDPNALAGALIATPFLSIFWWWVHRVE